MKNKSKKNLFDETICLFCGKTIYFKRENQFMHDSCKEISEFELMKDFIMENEQELEEVEYVRVRPMRINMENY